MNKKYDKSHLRSGLRGVVLLGVVLVMTVVSIYLAGYALWAIYDQKNLMRQQEVDKAEAFALAGLERARSDLFLDSTWLDGVINGNCVSGCALSNCPISGCTPDPDNPDQFYDLYTPAETPFGEGSYRVQIDYLQYPKDCTSGCAFFYERRILVRSIGYIPNASAPQASRTLEEIVSWYKVKNLDQDKLYSMLQPAIDRSSPGDRLAITTAVLNENITINSNINIKGCYDEDFTPSRNCASYISRISGNVTINSPAQVELGGITIQ